MSTSHQFSEQISPYPATNNSAPVLRKGSHIMKRKTARKNHSELYFRFGGNRKDPLNLNALIRKRKPIHSGAAADSNENPADLPSQHGNDRPVEILLQPDIFDPLRLDPSSRNDEDLNPLSSIPSTSINTNSTDNVRVYPSRTKRLMRKRQHQHAPPRFGNFRGYYGYRQPNEDQRLQYLQSDWFHDKRVLDIGCHTGHVTFYVAEHFQPREIVGLDIDQHLVQQAQNQLRHRMERHPPPYSDPNQIMDQPKRYPHNLRFQQNY